MPKSTAAVGLPPGDVVRWSPQRKAAVVGAVSNGVISLDEACRRYRLSHEEFQAWRQAIEAHGIGGLSIKGYRYYRGVLRHTEVARGEVTQSALP